MDKIQLKRRTQQFAIAVIKFTESLPSGRAINVLSNQLLRSSTSVGANYRAACKGKSTADFINKIVICEEEADESIYWFELIEEADLISAVIIAPLKKEATELTAILRLLAKLRKKIKN